jgi:hypothetical protein
MLYTLLRLSITQPQLLVEHADAYSELVSTEFHSASMLWQRRLWLNALAVGCLAVAAVLAGVAWMFWAVTPVENIRVPWALICAPLLPCVLALWCLIQARAPSHGAAFEKLLEQLRADIAMLRKVSAP